MLEWLSTIRPDGVFQAFIVLGGGLVFIVTMRDTIDRVSDRLTSLEKAFEKYGSRIEDGIRNEEHIKFLRRDVDQLYADRGHPRPEINRRAKD